MSSTKNITFFIFSIALSGCVNTKQFKEGKYVLYNQKTKVPKAVNAKELQDQLVQKRNRRLIGLPIFYKARIYDNGLKRYDSLKYINKKEKLEMKFQSKINEHSTNAYKVNKLIGKLATKKATQDKALENGNMFMRWGEPLVYLDSAAIQQSVVKMKRYLYSKGWFNAQIHYKVSFIRKRAYITYTTKVNKPFTIDSVYLNIDDSQIDSLLKSRPNKLLKKNTQYDQSKLTKERENIESLLKNNGYFDFSKQYIKYQVDTTAAANTASINLSIYAPNDKENHQVYRIDSVIFITDATVQNFTSKRINQPYKGINYQYFKSIYSKKTLNRRVFIKPELLYSKENTINTQQELANMDIFKFVNISFDTTGGKFIANIFTRPLEKYQFSSETGLSINSSGLPGPFIVASIKKRNLFHRLGIFEVDGRIGIEGVASASDQDRLLSNIGIGANAKVTFPQFFLPLSEETKLKLRLFDPKTQVKIGITYNNRPEFQRTILNATNSYAWKSGKTQQFNFKLIDINLVKTPFIAAAYSARLLELDLLGNNLINSFKDALVSSFSLTYTSNKNYYGIGGLGTYFSSSLEPGGTFNSVWSSVGFVNSDSLQLFSYVRGQADYRRVSPKGRKGTLAFKGKIGLAIPYGDNNVLPYEKYFFAGGSTSNRAWKSRRLGPGAYNHVDESKNVTYQFEQQGELVMESSLEYRQNIIGFIQGAVFLDAGNIWTLNEELSRPGSVFNVDKFVRQIALGGGVGLRFDFSFLLIRLDTAFKLADPARPLGSRFILNKGFNSPPFDDRIRTEPFVIHFAIGYPF